MQDLRTDNTLLDIIAILRRHILGMLLVFVGVVSVVTIKILMMTPIYEVESRILVKYGREYVYHTVEGRVEGDMAPLNNFNENEVIANELQIFNSSELAEEVITSLGIETIFPDLARNGQDKNRVLPFAVGRFGAMLNASHIKGSSVINVALQHQDPLVAVKAVKLLIERFKERHLEIFKNPQLSLLEQQVADYRIQLQEVEDAKKNFLQENKIVSLDAQRKTLIFNYEELKSQLITQKVAFVGLAERKEFLESEIKKFPEISVFSEVDAKGNESNIVGGKYLELKLIAEDLRLKYPDNNRLVTSTQAKIDETEEFIASQEANWRNTVTRGKDKGLRKVEEELVSLRASYSATKEKNKTLQEELNQKHSELLQLIGLDVEFRRLNRNIEEKENFYFEYSKKLEMTRIQEIMDKEKMVNLVVIEKPMVPLKPVKPRKKIRLLVGLVLGVTCSLFYCLVGEYVNNRSGLRD